MKNIKIRNTTQSHMRESQYSKIMNPMVFSDEKFVQISQFIPTIKDYYWISNYGRIYTSYKDCSLLQDLARGYTHTTLSKKDGTSQVYDIRELYYQAFNQYYN